MRSVVEIGASVPAFLGKLWKLVNDSETNHLISWSPGGKTFIIKNQADFARELLPLYYKHNNMASFIRQLNMYGFHKITSVETGGLRYEKDEIEFSHPCFMKAHAYLLEHIKRKIANPKSIVTRNESGEKVLWKPELMNKVLADVKQMKGKQENLDTKFSVLKQENETLWREVAVLRQKHMKQQQIVNNLIQFLISLVQPTRPSNSNGNNVGVKRPYQLMINSAAHNTADSTYPSRLKSMKMAKETLLEEMAEDMEDGPTIHELAHDDILHSETSPGEVPPVDFVTIEVPNMPNASTSHSPIDPSTSMYHVTMEDGDENEAGRIAYPICRTNSTQSISDCLPIITSVSSAPATPTVIDPTTMEQVVNVMASPSPSSTKGKSKGKGRNAPRSTPAMDKTLLSHSNFNTLQPTADLKLPAEIFASDDSVSDAGVVAPEEVSMQNALNNLVENALLGSSKDQMLGGINIKVEKPVDPSHSGKKSKKSNETNDAALKLNNIKTELQDDLDWNNMTLATVNNNTNVNRFPTRTRRDNITKNRDEYSSLFGTNSDKGDIDDHLDAMQTDLESLRELLRSDGYAFDTNTLLGLFGSDDPFYGLPYNSTDERAKTANNVEGNQLISYTGNIPDFEDIDMPELECDSSQDAVPSPAPSTLNTPQAHTRMAPFTPKP